MIQFDEHIFQMGGSIREWLIGGLGPRWFGFLGSPYERDCLLLRGTPIRIPNHRAKKNSNLPLGGSTWHFVMVRIMATYPSSPRSQLEFTTNTPLLCLQSVSLKFYYGILLGQWLNFKLLGITYLVGKIKFKLYFQGPLAKRGMYVYIYIFFFWGGCGPLPVTVTTRTLPFLGSGIPN